MRIFCVALIAVCLSNLALAQQPEGTLSGLVTDPSGAVVANLPVRIEHWNLGKSLPAELKQDSVLMTGADGRYSTNLNPGIYDVIFSYPIFCPVAKRVKVEAGKIVDSSVKLKFDPLEKFVEVR